MRLIRLLCLSLILLPALVFADDAKLAPDLSDVSSLPVHVAPAADISKAMATAGNKSRPLQFAVKAALPVGLAGGYWDQPDAATARWRTRVQSAGALGLALEFSRYSLPEGAALWLYDEDGRLVQGPYTQANHTPEGKLWTAIVPGAAAVVELRVPTEKRSDVQLELGQLSHAFLDLAKVESWSQAKSGSCNVDTICADGNNWRDEIRSVAHITIGNEFVCTGQLLNSVPQDTARLFITANHCEIGQGTTTPASSVVFYWNYQTSSCSGTPDGILTQNQSGSTLLAGDVGSDFTLVQLNQTPPTSFNVHLAGWDARNTAPQSGVSIHHPSGDEKRISTYTAPAVATPVCIDESITGACTRSVQAWRVNWARGTTEGGSSGGGLWNQSHRLVGVLSGGNASCSNLSGDDYYARLSVAYTANAAASGQLKVWLDPANTGATNIAGRNPGELNDPDEDSGGGSFGIFGLLALLGLRGLRRK